MSVQNTRQTLIPTMSDQPILDEKWARFLCGGVAGAISRTMTAPIDRVKVLRQVSVPELVGKSFPQSLKIMYREGGIVSFWRSNGINVLKNCPESAIRFGLHGLLKSILFPEATGGQLRPEQRLLVASMAGAISLTCTYPVEILKTRMALRKTTDPNSIAYYVRKAYQEGGLRGFYRGYKISMMSYVPYSGMELAIYEMLKRTYLRYHGSTDPSASHHVPTPITIGIVTTSCSIPILIVYPANLLRTRFQASTNPRAEPILASFRSIWQQSGFFGFYRGMGASLSKTLPSVCITYVVFEFCSELLHIPGLGSR